MCSMKYHASKILEEWGNGSTHEVGGQLHAPVTYFHPTRVLIGPRALLEAM